MTKLFSTQEISPKKIEVVPTVLPTQKTQLNVSFIVKIISLIVFIGGIINLLTSILKLLELSNFLSSIMGIIIGGFTIMAAGDLRFGKKRGIIFYTIIGGLMVLDRIKIFMIFKEFPIKETLLSLVPILIILYLWTVCWKKFTR